MASEVAMFKRLKKAKTQLESLKEGLGAKLVLERVENLLSKSTPDVNGCFFGTHFDIELKQVDRPKRKTTKIKARFEQGQESWLLEKTQAGGNAFVLLQVNGETFITTKWYLIPGDKLEGLGEGLLENEIKERSLNLQFEFKNTNDPLVIFFSIMFSTYSKSYPLLAEIIETEKEYRYASCKK